MLIDPRALLQYWLPVLLVSVAVIVGKTLTCTFGGALAGHDGRNARAGLSLAQIGEFSFVIASLGLSLQGDQRFPLSHRRGGTAFVTPSPRALLLTASPRRLSGACRAQCACCSPPMPTGSPD